MHKGVIKVLKLFLFFFFNFRVKLLSPKSHNNLTRTIIKTALKFRPKEIP